MVFDRFDPSDAAWPLHYRGMRDGDRRVERKTGAPFLKTGSSEQANAGHQISDE